MAEETGLPSLEDFCLKAPLYKKYRFMTADDTVPEYEIQEKIKNLHFDIISLDCYCIDCKKNSIFNATKLRTIETKDGYYSVTEESRLLYEDHIFSREYECSRDRRHTVLHFSFIIIDCAIMKYGQYPSMADISTAEIQKYHKILENDLFKEFSRAVGLISHGVGIGAFVYLRRIFEGLVEEAHQRAQSETGWDEDAYNKMRMDEKIGMLTGHLPPFLVENKKIYSILSKGIHELSEDECKRHFDAVKMGIELILDQKIRQKEEKEKEQKARISLQKVHQEVKGSKKKAGGGGGDG